MNYYVYVHRDSEGNVVYVGKGKNNRDENISDRSSAWVNGISNPFFVDRLCEGLDHSTALLIEMSIIKALNPELNLKVYKKVLLPEDFKDHCEDVIKPDINAVNKVDYEKRKRLKTKFNKNKLTPEEEIAVSRGDLLTSNDFLTDDQIKIKKSIAKKLKVQRRCKEKLHIL